MARVLASENIAKTGSRQSKTLASSFKVSGIQCCKVRHDRAISPAIVTILNFETLKLLSPHVAIPPQMGSNAPRVTTDVGNKFHIFPQRGNV
jgi:hypothetical protein